ncbi:MAG: DUF167 domain-containing protein [Planctomycetes bacterium]|nr:DUF167 domain-containing protein [Planctomycetota bacterium]
MTLDVVADAAGARFAVKVVPGAARDRIAGLLGSALKVQVTAPAEQGQANARLCAILAEALGVPTRAVQVAAGHGSPRKVIAVRGLDAATVRTRLHADA